MSTLDTSIIDLGNLIEKGLRVDLKAMIKAKLVASVDGILEDMAIEIAQNIVVSVESFKAQEPNGFGPETRVIVNFNLKEPSMLYDSKTREIKRRDAIAR
jgi:hypothetical protein